MPEYQYTKDTIPDPVVGAGKYMFPVLQYFDGESKIVFPPDVANADPAGQAVRIPARPYGPPLARGASPAPPLLRATLGRPCRRGGRG